MATELFHVKQTDNKMNKEILFPYTEIPENLVQDILDVHPPEQPAQRVNRCPQLFGSQFLPQFDHLDTARKRRCGLLQ